MVHWEVALLQLDRCLTEEGAFDPDEFETTFSESLAGKTFLQHCVEAWGRASIAGGADEGLAAETSNRMSDILMTGAVQGDPRMKEWERIGLQGAVQGYVDRSSIDIDVITERDTCVAELLSHAAAIILAHHATLGMMLGDHDWTIDPRWLLPFAWFQRESLIGRFNGPTRQCYRLLGHEEYVLATLRFSEPRSAAPATAAPVPRTLLTIELPIRQVGTVLRDEVAAHDRVEMSWSIPPYAPEMVELDVTRSPKEILDAAVDETKKIVVHSHLGFPHALYELSCRPAATRTYPIPVEARSDR